MEKANSEIIDFSDIIGHDELKSELLNLFFVFVYKHNEWVAYLKEVRNEAANAYLMLGAPGLGKSAIMLAIERALKGNAHLDVNYVKGSCLHGTLGSNAKLIETVFANARNTPKKASVLLIDEIDGIMQIKQGINSVERTNALIAELEGLQDSSKIIVIGAANSIEKCEPAAISRFKQIYLSAPGEYERRQFIKRYFFPLQFKSDINIQLDEIIKFTDGLTGRNYSQISATLKMKQLRVGALDIVDLLSAISKYSGRMGFVKKASNIPSDNMCIR